MPSFNEIIGIIVTAIVLANASGHGDWVWKSIGEIRQMALTESHREWPCPSVFNKNACTNYDSARYK